jgi:serine/threonine-protein kinase 24/25/MST4
MIHEKGMLQIIDFGVAGVMESKAHKRTTMVGTPHWMPPELHINNRGLKYGTEVSRTELNIT